MQLSKTLIVLLFTLLMGSISMAGAADTFVIGTITAIDTEERKLIVSLVHPTQAPGETIASSATVHVRLEWDSGDPTPFETLLPGCVTRGNAVRINGVFDRDRSFMAETIHGCGSGDFSDDTGVRFRLNRARGACAPE